MALGLDVTPLLLGQKTSDGLNHETLWITDPTGTYIDRNKGVYVSNGQFVGADSMNQALLGNFYDLNLVTNEFSVSPTVMDLFRQDGASVSLFQDLVDNMTPFSGPSFNPGYNAGFDTVYGGMPQYAQFDPNYSGSSGYANYSIYDSYSGSDYSGSGYSNYAAYSGSGYADYSFADYSSYGYTDYSGGNAGYSGFSNYVYDSGQDYSFAPSYDSGSSWGSGAAAPYQTASFGETQWNDFADDSNLSQTAEGNAVFQSSRDYDFSSMAAAGRIPEHWLPAATPGISQNDSGNLGAFNTSNYNAQPQNLAISGSSWVSNAWEGGSN